MNIPNGKVVDSAFKNHKTFFINIGTYRDKTVQTCQLFANSRPVKFRSRDRASPNLVHIKSLLAPMLCLNFSFAH